VGKAPFDATALEVYAEGKAPVDGKGEEKPEGDVFKEL